MAKVSPSLQHYAASLRQNPDFRAFVKARVIPNIPPRKPWSPGATVEEWAHMTGLAEGYLLALTEFGINLDDYRNHDQ